MQGDGQLMKAVENELNKSIKRHLESGKLFLHRNRAQHSKYFPVCSHDGGSPTMDQYSIQRGVDTPSRFMLMKAEISAGLMGLLF